MLHAKKDAGAGLDPIWRDLRSEANRMAADEPLMAGLAHAVVLRHESLEDALSYRFAETLDGPGLSAMVLREIAEEAFRCDPSIPIAARADINAVLERDPACHRNLEPVLFFKGFQALVGYRVSHWLWSEGRRDLALYIQMLQSRAFSIDIHPGARLGKGIMIDHAHAIVIGETAVLGDGCSLLHAVTLGGTGKDDDDRHPKIGIGVLIGAGAKVLGNIRVGDCSRIAAGSVVLEDVPACKTVAGVPARVVGDAGCSNPANSMNHLVHAPDGLG